MFYNYKKMTIISMSVLLLSTTFFHIQLAETYNWDARGGSGNGGETKKIVAKHSNTFSVEKMFVLRRK